MMLRQLGGLLVLINICAAGAMAQNQVNLIREARIQSFLKETNSPKDIYDPYIRSPKSASFSLDGTKLYVNSLEGAQTAVYYWPTLQRKTVIDHRFGAKNQALFNDQETIFDYTYFSKPEQGANYFRGKPVEMAFSHGGSYLWITYYRRDYDVSAQSPSAVAIVDTATDRIVRVMPTGPIPKYVAISPDSSKAVITHWGDNTIGVIDIRSNNVMDFAYTSQLSVEKQLSQEGLEGTDRDKTCGYCLRGTVFSQDSRYAFVARMGGGGLAVFDLDQNVYLGSIMDFKNTLRHIVLSENKKELVMTSNSAGFVTKINVDDALKLVVNANGKRVKGIAKKEVFVGKGARTLEIDPSGKTAFVAINDDIKVVAVDLETMKIVGEAKLDPYPVGLAISKDGNYLVITSQGHDGQGGNAVNIIRIER